MTRKLWLSTAGFIIVERTWFELWHHEGRRARMAASMQAPDYTHWHGTYDLAKHFYTKMVPELEHLIEENHNSSDPNKAKAAGDLKNKLAKARASIPPTPCWRRPTTRTSCCVPSPSAFRYSATTRIRSAFPGAGPSHSVIRNHGLRYRRWCN